VWERWLFLALSYLAQTTQLEEALTNISEAQTYLAYPKACYLLLTYIQYVETLTSQANLPIGVSIFENLKKIPEFCTAR
jgi:hypothetical protein